MLFMSDYFLSVWVQKESPLGLPTQSAHPDDIFHLGLVVQIGKWQCKVVDLFHIRERVQELIFNVFHIAARFSPDDKYSRQRVLLKKRFGLLPTQQSPLKH
ncbi:hypothetical protein Tsubulata_015291 [Turnera subulata]|uniref:Nucleolar protein 10 n=1 Tax=Turnera subulata TaxID=218843 RepID=A0A9Q0FJ27_9ROSI|nr:hypothetical protein Tsubulata_015291 [Turnera subulata]